MKVVGDDAGSVLAWALGKARVAGERDATSEQVAAGERSVAADAQSVAAEPDMKSERAVAVEKAATSEQSVAAEHATANEALSTAVRFIDYDESAQVVAFPCAWLADARNAFPAVDFIESLNVVELDDSGMPVVREVDARIVL